MPITPATADEANAKRFQEHCQQGVFRVDKLIEEKRSELETYIALEKRLNDLPKKLQHHIMVPFGSVGFMPGKIVRTNEVMMLLGDNYFAEKSCHEANEVLDRRKLVISKAIEDHEKEKKMILDQLAQADKLFSPSTSTCRKGDEVEIREEYDEEKEMEFREARRRRLQDRKIKNASANEKDIIAHLEAMELIENENGEMETDVVDAVVDEALKTLKPPPGVSKEEFDKLIATIDEMSSDEDEEYDEEQEEAEEEEEEEEKDDEEKENDNTKKDDLDSDDELPKEQQAKSAKSENQKLNYKRADMDCKPKRKRSVQFSAQIEDSVLIDKHAPPSEVNTKPLIEEIPTPSTSSERSTSSILKNKDIQSPLDHEAIAKMNQNEKGRTIVPGSKDAFSGEIVERSEPSFAEGCVAEPSTSNEESKPRRVSKFKQRRMV